MKLLTLVLLVAGTLPTSSAAAVGPREEAALRRIEHAEDLLGTSRLADAVAAAAELADVSFRGESSQPAVVPAGTPAALAAPVSQLLGAIETAEDLIEEAIPADPALEMTPASYIRIGELMARATGSPPDASALGALQRRHREVRALVDEPALFTAGLILAQALDRSLPLLLGGAADLPTASPVVGCDVLDLPVLCIAGTGDNALTSDRALVIDLGGNDLHTHSAGGASTALPVAVTIDVAGNDRYERTAGPAQGAGNLGAGMLVDAAGDDVYSVAAADGIPASSVFGQGTNFSTGDGLLADLDGSDTYSLVNTKREQATANGQGSGGQPGFGILLDQGAGNESYTVSAHPSKLIETPDEVKVGGLNAGGLATGGLGGVGILSDAGGTDAMTVETLAAVVPPEESRPVTSVPLTGPSGFGQAGIGGAALMLTGPGDTTRTTAVSLVGTWSGIATSNGFGSGLQGLGALVDRGGDDTYTATAVSHAERRVIVDDACGCDGGHAETHNSIPNVASVSMHVMGAALGGGFGVLRDEAGDDVYSATVESTAVAVVHDERTAPGAEGFGASDATATANAASLEAQGAGAGSTGILEDQGGDDTYETRNVSQATAVAEAAMPGVETRATATSEDIYNNVQAAGTSSGPVPGQGLLQDTGGADAYIAYSESTAAASPETEVASGTLFSSAQGSVAGNSQALLTDDDAGEADAFTLTPADPACTGTRGQGTWQDCGDGLGVGIVDNG